MCYPGEYLLVGASAHLARVNFLIENGMPADADPRCQAIWEAEHPDICAKSDEIADQIWREFEERQVRRREGGV